MKKPDPDWGMFETDLEELLRALKTAGTGEPAADVPRHVLSRAGILSADGLSEGGRELYKTVWVRGEKQLGTEALGQALRALNPIQVLEQELSGYGPISEVGALNLLHLHRGAPPQLTVEQLRKAFNWLTQTRTLAYSKKYKTVRSLLPPPESAKPGEVRSLAAMVSPATPFSNIARLRRILRSLTGKVYWADPHFGTRAFEELVDELDSDRVSELRVLSGNVEGDGAAKSFNDYKRFRSEMGSKGISVEWRTDPARDWHDRWLVAEDAIYNMPPINTLFKGDYSEMLPSSDLPPLGTWWQRSSAR